jgi:hypothetical protein
VSDEETFPRAIAASVRLLAGAVREIDRAGLLESCAWGEVFGEGSGGNTDKATDACPPGAAVDLTPPTRADVADVIAAAHGENAEAEWVGVFRLRDGRFLLATGWCDYTGFDCQAGNHLEVAASLADLLAVGLTDGQKRRLNLAPGDPP